VALWRYAVGPFAPGFSSRRSTAQLSCDIQVLTPSLGKTQRLITTQATINPTIQIHSGITPPCSRAAPKGQRNVPLQSTLVILVYHPAIQRDMAYPRTAA